MPETVQVEQPGRLADLPRPDWRLGLDMAEAAGLGSLLPVLRGEGGGGRIRGSANLGSNLKSTAAK